MERKTNVSGDFKKYVGLQFFAEGTAEAGADTNADSTTDEFDESAFLEGLGEADGENQPEGETNPTEEETAAGENQPAEQENTPDSGTNEGGETNGQVQATGRQEETLPLTFNGKQTALPKSAISAISQTLGADAITLLQKGMAFDGKNSREIGILQRLADAEGMKLPDYVTGLEGSIAETELNREMERVAKGLPETTPQEALRAIAEKNLAENRAERERAAEQQRTREKNEERERAQSEIKNRVTADAALWKRYSEVSGIKDAKDVPKEIFEAVRAGKTPLEAHFEMQNKKLTADLAAAQKNNKNKSAAPGAMSTNEADKDEIAAIFLR